MSDRTEIRLGVPWNWSCFHHIDLLHSTCISQSSLPLLKCVIAQWALRWVGTCTWARALMPAINSQRCLIPEFYISLKWPQCAGTFNPLSISTASTEKPHCINCKVTRVEDSICTGAVILPPSHSSIHPSIQRKSFWLMMRAVRQPRTSKPVNPPLEKVLVVYVRFPEKYKFCIIKNPFS